MFVINARENELRILNQPYFGATATSLSNYSEKVKSEKSANLLFLQGPTPPYIGVTAVGGFKFSMKQKKNAKSASLGKCQLGDKNLTLGRTIFFSFVGGKNFTPSSALNDLK